MSGSGSGRRFRRGITGTRNKESVETLNCGEENDATVLRGGVLVRATTARHDSLAETNSAGRIIAHKVHDKIYNTLQPAYVRQLLRCYDPQHTGTVSTDHLRQTLGRLNIGLSDAEKEQVVRRLPVDAAGRVLAEDFMHSFEALQPLGAITPARPKRFVQSGTTRRAAESRSGRLNAWDARSKPSADPLPQQNVDPGVPAVPAFRQRGPDGGPASATAPCSPRGRGGGGGFGGAWGAGPGSPRGAASTPRGSATENRHAQQSEDVHLMHQLSVKLTQHREKLRLALRKFDTTNSGKVNKAEFVFGMQGLHLPATHRQLQRVAEVVGDDGGGQVDYETFCSSLELALTHKAAPPAMVPAGTTLAAALDIHPDEALHVARSDRAAELRIRLFAKGDRVNGIFKQHDVNNDGRLSLDQLTSSCQALLPGISQREVACLMVKKGGEVTDGGDGYQDFREFILNVRDDDVAAPHPLSSPRDFTAPPAASQPRNGWGYSPIWTRPTTPRSPRGPEGVPGSKTAYSSTRRINAAAAEEVDAGYTAGAAVHAAGVSSVLSSLRALALPKMRPITCPTLGSPRGGLDLPPAPGDSGPLPQSSYVQRSSSADCAAALGPPSSPRNSLGLPTRSEAPSLGDGDGVCRVRPSTTPDFRGNAGGVRRGKGAGRFYNLLHHDTGNMTILAPSGAPNFQSSSDTFVRKGDAAFHAYQQDDRNRRMGVKEDWRLRTEFRTECDTGRVQRDADSAERHDAARLFNKGSSDDRAQERADLRNLNPRIDGEVERAITLFNRD